jgi:hypothetical protein
MMKSLSVNCIVQPGNKSYLQIIGLIQEEIVSLAHGECKICMRGSIDSRWVDFYGEVGRDELKKGGEIQSTTITQDVPDLADFIGIINRLSDMGYPVISLEYRQKD